VEHDSWEKKEDLENTEEAVEEFEGRINMEVRRQKQISGGENYLGNLWQRCCMGGIMKNLRRST